MFNPVAITQSVSLTLPLSTVHCPVFSFNKIWMGKVFIFRAYHYGVIGVSFLSCTCGEFGRWLHHFYLCTVQVSLDLWSEWCVHAIMNVDWTVSPAILWYINFTDRNEKMMKCFLILLSNINANIWQD